MPRILVAILAFASLWVLAHNNGLHAQSIPFIEPGPCAVPIARTERADCLYLTVFEDRTAHGGRTIRLPLVLFHSRAAKPNADPVLFTVGGPGNSTIRDVRSGSDFKSLDDRDFIAFEQRGTRYAQPQLDCPEFNAVDDLYFDRNLNFEQAGKAQVAAAAKCYKRLSASGIHLSAYNTAAIADDVADLCKALGLQKVNLMGLSYSTTIDMEVVRRHPTLVRSVVLDSVLPVDAHYDEAANANVVRSLHEVFDSCAVGPTCVHQYTNLYAAFHALVQRLNAHPLSVNLKGTSGKPIRYRVSGRNAAEAIYGVGLQNAENIPQVPRVIWRAHMRDYAPLLHWLQESMGGSSYAYGARLSVICHDWSPFESDALIENQAALYPELGGMNAADFPPAVCSAWPVGSADPNSIQPVQSDIPVLVFAGAFDPNTPPQWGQHIRMSLPNSYFIEFPTGSHDAALNTLCGLALAATFFDNPREQPNVPCLWRRRPPTFAFNIPNTLSAGSFRVRA